MKTQCQFLVALGMMLLFSSMAPAQSVPPLINYQGRLTDQTGSPLPAGAYTLQFRLWDSQTATNAGGGGDLIWGQQYANIAVQSNGVFNVILGSPGGSPIAEATPAVNNLAYAFSGSNCFLGLTAISTPSGSVSSPSEILPRQQLLSVPFAVQAQQAAQALVASSLVSNLAYALCPPGTVVAYMGTNAPPGWLLCDGSLVSRTNDATLFSVIGTASGSGDGSTTFNLPDLRGVFLRGMNGSRSDSFADSDDNTTLRTNIFTGGNTGNAVGSYQQDAFAAHYHQTTMSDNNGVANTWGNPLGHGVGGEFSGTSDGGIDPTSTVGGSETRPKNAYVNYIIKY
jgi:hypothetical protein